MSHLVFTLDFHEFVRGQLSSGKECNVSYDPLRLAAGKTGYVHGSSDYEFTAHISFLPEGNTEVKLYSEIGWVQKNVIKNDGTGSMLVGSFTIPGNVEEIIAWITMKDKDGNIYYDSDQGKNFHFRIEKQDIKSITAAVTSNKEAGISEFQLNASSAAAVDKVIARYRITNSKEPFHETPVELSSNTANNEKEWTTGKINVPYGSVVVYDLQYFIGGNRFKVENNGQYYIAESVE